MQKDESQMSEHRIDLKSLDPKLVPPDLRAKIEAQLPAASLAQRRLTDSNETLLRHPSNAAQR